MNLNNTYYILRHGEAISNVKSVMSSWPETFENPLTPHGLEIIRESASRLKDKNIDMIFASDLLRTAQTAAIISEALNLEVKFDTRLRELDFGILNGKPITALDEAFGREADRIDNKVDGAETYADVLARMKDFLQDLENRYAQKCILIISHEGPLWMLEAYVDGMSLREGLEKIPRDQRIHKGQIKQLN